MRRNCKPLCVDLFCGLGGWAEGLISEGWTVIGFDIECWPYPGQLVLQDVRTLHGSQFKDADLIVASPPCNEYSYRAMPWKRAKALPPPDNTLFETCFRIQREASEAAGKNIPLIVENVRGAQKWVGRAKWHYGSYYLWGDVPALMPITFNGRKMPEGIKVPGTNGPIMWKDRRFQRLEDAVKMHAEGHYTKADSGRDWFDMGPALYGSGSNARKQASALIAMIPFPLAQHIARAFK